VTGGGTGHTTKGETTPGVTGTATTTAVANEAVVGSGGGTSSGQARPGRAGRGPVTDGAEARGGGGGRMPPPPATEVLIYAEPGGVAEWPPPMEANRRPHGRPQAASRQLGSGPVVAEGSRGGEGGAGAPRPEQRSRRILDNSSMRVTHMRDPGVHEMLISGSSARLNCPWSICLVALSLSP
jgi:hypothetical protein